MAYSATGGW